jgi:hypothetical protein
MKFIQEFGYTVKVGQEEAHQEWLIENDERPFVPSFSEYVPCHRAWPDAIVGDRRDNARKGQ